MAKAISRSGKCKSDLTTEIGGLTSKLAGIHGGIASKEQALASKVTKLQQLQQHEVADEHHADDEARREEQ